MWISKYDFVYSMDNMPRATVELLLDYDTGYQEFKTMLADSFPGKVIVKCQHCGQWGARKTECVKCGAPID